MSYPEFKLESYFAEREFKAPYHLCASDVESWTLGELLEMADEETRGLWENLRLQYTETEGHPLLREEIAKGYGNEIQADHVLCTAGAEEAIFCVINELMGSKDHAVVVTPCYQSLESIASTIGSTTKVALSHKQGWVLDLNAVEAALQTNTKLLVINYPHNPTGAVISKEMQQALVELARKHGLWIFSDEVYRFLEIDSTDRLPPMASVYEKGVSLSVTSKAYGLPGLRVGWIVSQDKSLLHRLNQRKHYLSICNSTPSEILALIGLRASDRLLARNAAILNDNLPHLDRFFETYRDWFEWVRPKGGCIGYPLFKGTMSTDQLAESLIDEVGVLILPRGIYDDANNHFRISFGRKSMLQALEKFAAFVEKHKGDWRAQI